MESKCLGLVALGERFSRHRAGCPRGRFPRDLKLAVLEAVNLGSRVSDVAASCGLNPVQIQHWRSQAAAPGSSAAKAFAPVRKIGIRAESNWVRICLPNGVVIEATPAQLDQILKVIGRLP